MKVARSLEELAGLEPVRSVVTLGVFDGVHRGHQHIIEELIARRDLGHAESAWLVTFDPHPVQVTHSLTTPALLTTIEERLELIGRFPVDGVFVLPFDHETAQVGYRDFIQRYFIEALDMQELVLGYDCHFGHNREGSPVSAMEEGARRGFAVKVVPAVNLDGEVVSSTTIRAKLQAGDLDGANNLLGHAFLIRGRVVEGQGRGRDLGFPTANLALPDPHKLWPPAGVYAVRVNWRGWIHEGMMNIGRSPTIKRGDRDEIEVHIFDFDKHLYGEELSVYCEAFLRPERKFATVTALIDQLSADREAAREWLGAG